MRWCQREISPRFPNFQFRVANVHNKEYNPTGYYEASEYKFPYESDSFDFVFLTSIFTHLLPAEAENYLSEISRVLKPGGRCFATFFLLNEESLKHLEAGESRMSFGYDFGDYRVKEKNTPEAAIAFHEKDIRGFHEKHGLGIEAPIHYGSWCGRGKFLDFQDIVVSSKPGSH